MAANDKQIDGEHYQGTEIQHWDWAQHILYLEGCATKYIARHRQKEGLLDIEKGLHFIQKIIERDYPEMELNWRIGKKIKPVNPYAGDKSSQNPYANVPLDEIPMLGGLYSR